jgi:hypothetical protein
MMIAREFDSHTIRQKCVTVSGFGLQTDAGFVLCCVVL